MYFYIIISSEILEIQFVNEVTVSRGFVWMKNFVGTPITFNSNIGLLFYLELIMVILIIR